MPRQKVTKSRRQTYPVRLQDARGLEEQLERTVIGPMLEPIEARVVKLEAAVRALERGVIHTAHLDLPAGRHSGITVFEPAEGFVEEAIGAPVLISQRSSQDDEAAIISFTAVVVSVRRLRVTWFCASPVPKGVTIVYLIG